MAGGRVKGITIEIDGDTKGLNSALKDVNSQTAKTSTELRDVNKLLKLDPGNTELIAQKQELLGKAVQSTSEKLATLKSAQAQVEAQFKSGDIGEAQYRDFQREVIATEGQLDRLQTGLKNTNEYFEGNKTAAGMAEAGFNKAAIKAQELDNNLDGIKSSSAQASDGLKDTSDNADKLAGNVDKISKVQVGEFLGGVAEKAADMGGAVLETGIQFANAQSNMQNTMGLTSDRAKSATDTVKSVFKSGMVESVDEANEAVQDVINSFGDLVSNGDLDGVSNKIVAIAQHSNVDMKDATNASSQAMKTMGLTSQQSLDLISKGLEDGLNKNDDFLDTVNEYSPTFNDAGISAGGMLNVLNAGMENGAFNTDKVADAVKEFQLRLTSGQLDEPMKSFSSATQDVFQKFKDGQATSAEVMASVGNDLKSMPADQAKAAVQGLGTQFEDLGQGASAALLSAATGTENLSGATDKLSKKTPGEKLTASLNTLKASFADLITQLTPVIDAIAGMISAFSKAPGPVKVLVGVIGAVMAVLAVLMPAITGIGTLIAAFGTAFLLPVIGIVAGIIAAITAVILVITNWGSIVKWLKGLWNGMVQFFSGLWNGIKQAFTVGVNAITQFLQPAFTATVNVIKAIWNGIVTFFSAIWDAIKLVFTVVITAIAVLIGTYINIWKSIITTAMNTIQVIFSTVWNAIKDVIMAVWNFLSPFISAAINAISNVISTVWNAISSVTSSVWNAISGVIQTVWNGISSFISGVINAISSVISSVWNAISGVTSSVWNSISSVISSVWNGIQSGVSSAVNAVSSVISNIWNGIKSVTSSVWNGIKDAITGPMDAAKNMISGIINAIKGFFSFSITWPHIPLPHFSINPSGWQIGDLLKGKIPSLGINWHAKGGIFNKPTLFAGQGGMHGVGEAGPEAVVPLNAKTLAGIGAGIAANMDNLGQPQININVYADVTDSTIKKIGREVQSAMARTARNKNVAMGGI